MYIAYFIAVIVITLGFVKVSEQLAAIRQALVEIGNSLTSIEERAESLRDVGDEVNDIADLARTYKKYNTFPLGELGRPLIGSESQYDR